MLKGIFTFIKRLVVSFLISCFVGISGIFSGIFMCESVKGTSLGNAFCASNGLMFGFVTYSLIAIFVLLFLSIRNKLSKAWLFYLIFWLMIGYYFLELVTSIKAIY